MDSVESSSRDSSTRDSSSDEDSFNYCPEYNALRDTTSALCSALPIKDLIPYLISAYVIDFEERENLCEGSATHHKITENFISKCLSPTLKLGDTKKFNKFMKVMQKSNKCDELVKRIEERIKHHQTKLRGSQPG